MGVSIFLFAEHTHDRKESHTTLEPSNTRPQFTLFIFSLRLLTHVEAHGCRTPFVL